MAGLAPDASPWDLTPETDPAGPYRPGQGDFNGIGLEDDAEYAPDPTTMPTSALLNTEAWCILAYGKVIQNATLSVVFGGGNPILNDVATLTNNAIAFTIDRTPSGAASGDVTITWPANTFPTAVARPKVSLNGITPGMVCADWVTNGVRIVAVNGANVAADLPFTVDLP